MFTFNETEKNMKYIIVALMLFCGIANADPYLIAGIGNSNVDSSFQTIGLGYKVNDNLSLEADYRYFGTQSQSGPDVVTRSAQPATFNGQIYYPVIIDRSAVNVKTSGEALSAIFTSGNPDMFIFGRAGIMLKTDKVSRHISSYVDQSASYHPAVNSSFTEKRAIPIMGVGFYLYGASVEVTDYGNAAYKADSTDKGLLLTYIISYRVIF